MKKDRNFEQGEAANTDLKNQGEQQNSGALGSTQETRGDYPQEGLSGGMNQTSDVPADYGITDEGDEDAVMGDVDME